MRAPHYTAGIEGQVSARDNLVVEAIKEEWCDGARKCSVMLRSALTLRSFQEVLYCCKKAGVTHLLRAGGAQVSESVCMRVCVCGALM